MTPVYDELVVDVRERGIERIGVILTQVRAEIDSVERWAADQVAEAWRSARIRVTEADDVGRRPAHEDDSAERTDRVRDAVRTEAAPAVRLPRDAASTRALVLDLRDAVGVDDEPLDRTPPPVPRFADLVAGSRGTARYLEALFGRA